MKNMLSYDTVFFQRYITWKSSKSFFVSCFRTKGGNLLKIWGREDRRMMEVRKSGILWIITLLIILFTLCPEIGKAQNGRPVADAGLPRYAAQDPAVLDGTGSYDPDNSGTLNYTWQQISGPSVFIIDANTATPAIGGSFTVPGRGGTPRLDGFIQTDGFRTSQNICHYANSQRIQFS